MVKQECKIEVLSTASGGKTVAIIVAGGSSSRMKGINKQFSLLLGKSVLLRSIEAFNNCNFVDRIVIVARPQDIPEVQRMVSDNSFSKVTDIVEGGSCRAESVKNGVLAAGDDAGIFLIHDGARPLVTREIIESVKNAAELYGAAACAVPLKDTVKKVDLSGKIIDTPDRSQLVAVGTPQGFKSDIYKKALVSVGELSDKITDDCMLVELSGQTVYTVEGSYDNIKITSPIDIIIAESILRERGEEGCE